MSEHVAVIEWSRNNAVFSDNQYSRRHLWKFDGGEVVNASSSPHVVKIPLSDPSCVDPEEAYVAALASCHMLWFLGLAASKGFVVDGYSDRATARLARNHEGRDWIPVVRLSPRVIFSGVKVPDSPAVDSLHHEAHESCFLAQSVRTEIIVNGSWDYVPRIQS